MRKIYGFLWVLLTLLYVEGTDLYAQYSYRQTPLLEVVEDLSEKSNFLILYREPMLSGITVTFSAKENELFQKLKQSLEATPLDIKIDTELQQIVFFKRKKGSLDKLKLITGQVIDAATGERLPYATISWQTPEGRKGIATNQAGEFAISTKKIKRNTLIRASYLGYEPLEIRLINSFTSETGNLIFRLNPVYSFGKEVVVNGFYKYTYNESAINTIELSQGSILGESNTIKSLQMLPSVSMGPAMSDGIHLRGSPEDGFQLLLDGVSLYNHTHLFGLFDNFNSDALQTGGLYYDIVPAYYQAPTGGTLSLITREGSLNQFKTQAGLSNTSARATVEGPLKKGKASFLLSGRVSLIDQLDWMGNRDLVAWGLDVDRPKKLIADTLRQVNKNLVQVNGTDAFFYDLHSKLYSESPGGTRYSISAYRGEDRLSVQGNRLFRSFDSSTNTGATELLPVKTENNWSNTKFSLQMETRLSESLFSTSRAGFSVFKTYFHKDDFTYTQVNPLNGSLESFTSALEIESILNELILNQDVEWVNGYQIVKAGFSYQYFTGEYLEDSFERPFYFQKRNAHQLDGYLQFDMRLNQFAEMNTGLRTSFYTSGNYLNWSPRARLRLFPYSIIQIGGGYSRNFQYVNKISFANVLSSDVWVMVNEEQPPTSVENITAGVYFEGGSLFRFHVEAYLKQYDHLRLHEIDTYSINRAFNATPWFSGNSAEGKGMEFLLTNKIGWLQMSNSFSISRMELQNKEINDGKPFPADWDRKYQYSSIVNVSLPKRVTVRLNQIIASGQPDKLAVSGASNDRLGWYYRTDLSINYTHKKDNRSIEAGFTVYNLFNRSNPWYREISFALDETGTIDRFLTLPSTVYDLGFQPSFSLSVRF